MSNSDIIVAQPWEVEKHLNPVRNTNHKYLRFVNSAVFSSEARHFLRHGYYTNAPYGSKDWVEYWDEQEKRCLEGYEVGGVRVTGRHYTYLNFTLIKARPIDPVTGLEKDTKKVITFPRFLDHQYYFFHELEECFAEGPHKGKSMIGMCCLKSRRKGISFANAGGIVGYNFNFVPASNTVIAAYMTDHYTPLLNGVHFCLNHINKHTDWVKRRQKIDKRDHFRASYSYKNEAGVDIEDGYMSEVMCKSFKDDPFKSIGESNFTVCWEEAGKFKGLLDAYVITEPTFRDGDIMTGVPVIWGTGGDVEEGGRDLAEMFYNPSAYGLKSYENIYDENTVGDCGWFIDDLWYLPGEYFDLETKKKHTLVDSEGNSHRYYTGLQLDNKRAIKAKGSRAAYRKFISQQPKTPAESLLRVEGSRFDTLRAQTRLSHILSNKKLFIDSIYLADLRSDPETGNILYSYNTTDEPLREYPIKDAETSKGCIEIYEQPIRDQAGKITPLRYIAGIDSYDDDVSSSNSVGSILVLDQLTDRIVCHYKGRPRANEFYERCRRILKYYNATANYERRNKGIYTYLYNLHQLHLLCDEPEILKDKGISKANTIGNNLKGTAPSEPVNNLGLELFEIYLSNKAYGEEDGSEVTNYDKQRSIALLREIISWNSNGNFDDISAAIMLMIYRESLRTVFTPNQDKIKTLADHKFWTQFNRNQARYARQHGPN